MSDFTLAWLVLNTPVLLGFVAVLLNQAIARARFERRAQERYSRQLPVRHAARRRYFPDGWTR